MLISEPLLSDTENCKMSKLSRIDRLQCVHTCLGLHFQYSTKPKHVRGLEKCLPESETKGTAIASNVSFKQS